MSEGNVFGQPYRSADDKLLDDLGKTQPAWAKETTRIVPPSHTFTGADLKIGGEEKTAIEGERIPMAGRKVDHDFAANMKEYRRLMEERDMLISIGAEDAATLPVPRAPVAPGEPIIQPKDWKDDRFEVDDDAMLQAKADDAHDEYIRDRDAIPPLTTKEEAFLIAKDLLSKAANPLLKVTPKLAIPKSVEKVRVMAGVDIPVTDHDQEVTFQVEPVGMDLGRAEYIYEPRPGTKDSNPKEAFGSRKAGLSTISRQVLYEVGLAMLEGALKYGRHNYRIAGVRASTYYDACGRHMDAWWEGQDIDPDSGAKLHHITKAIAGLTVIRDSMLAGNWTDDRPPSIGDPNWLAWYNEQAAILVDACKNPKRPYVKGDNE